MITIPTTKQLYDGIISDLETEYGNTIPLFGKVFLRAIAMVQAGKLKLYYLAIGKLQKNIFVDTADSESTGGTLERFGRVKLGRNPFPARAGQYEVEVTGVIGAVIPASSTFKSNDDSLNPGKLYVLDIAYTLTATTDTITVRALEAGTGNKISVNDLLTATAPTANVDKMVKVTAELVAPLEPENLEEYRQKALDAYRLEPQGGAPTDYRLWSYDAAGVKQTYPFARTGYSGQINLYIEANLIDSTDGKGTPSALILTDVETVVNFDPDISRPLNERGRRPVQAIVNYLPVSPKDIDIDIVGYVGLTPALEASFFNALKAKVNTIRPFVAGADILENKNDILDKNTIIATILSVRPGSVFTAINLRVDGADVSTFTFENGDIPYFNTVNYI